MYLGVTGSCMVWMVLVATAAQQLFLPNAEPRALQIAGCLVGLGLGVWWGRGFGGRWSRMG